MVNPIFIPSQGAYGMRYMHHAALSMLVSTKIRLRQEMEKRDSKSCLFSFFVFLLGWDWDWWERGSFAVWARVNRWRKEET